jgi:soluble lytic murein transglycosylase-like protein
VNLFFMMLLTGWILFVPLNARLHLRPYGTPEVVTNFLKRVEAKVEPVAPAAPDAPSTFEEEHAMGSAELMKRWDPVIAEAARKVGIPEKYIRAVIRMESGGRTMLGENQPIKSHAGAVGLMQLMPKTYAEMRAQLGLGADAYNPHDNVIAGAAYLGRLYKRYGYPAMFAAYNAGPGNLEDHLYRGRALPDETKNYVKGVAGFLGEKSASVEPVQTKSGAAAYAELTRPDGSTVRIDKALVRSVRKPLPNEYAANVQAVVTVGRAQYGVLETVSDAMKLSLG